VITKYTVYSKLCGKLKQPRMVSGVFPFDLDKSSSRGIWNGQNTYSARMFVALGAIQTPETKANSTSHIQLQTPYSSHFFRNIPQPSTQQCICKVAYRRFVPVSATDEISETDLKPAFQKLGQENNIIINIVQHEPPAAKLFSGESF
jgi:hypothetical protein